MFRSEQLAPTSAPHPTATVSGIRNQSVKTLCGLILTAVKPLRCPHHPAPTSAPAITFSVVKTAPLSSSLRRSASGASGLLTTWQGMATNWLAKERAARQPLATTRSERVSYTRCTRSTLYCEGNRCHVSHSPPRVATSREKERCRELRRCMRSSTPNSSSQHLEFFIMFHGPTCILKCPIRLIPAGR